MLWEAHERRKSATLRPITVLNSLSITRLLFL
jgi:hypothetical protein